MSSRTIFPRCLSLALIAIFFAQAAAFGQISGQDRSRSKKMLEQLRKDVEKHYYDPGFNGVDVEGAYQAALKEIEAAPNLTMAMAALSEFMNAFGDSHTIFIPPLRIEQVDYGFDMMFVGDTCFVVEVDEDGPAAAAGLEIGDAVLYVARFKPKRESFQRLEYALNVMYPQAKLGLVVRSTDGGKRPLEIFARVTELPFHRLDPSNTFMMRWWRDEARREAKENPYIRVEVGEEVLVWKMPEFGVGARHLVEEMAKRARKRRALILDLRDNPGGSLKTLDRLIGVLFSEPVVVGTVRTRKGEEQRVVKPYRGGVFDGQLVVLVDSRSASSSEILARLVQLEGRGLVIGDRTMGAVMTGRFEDHKVGFGNYWVYYSMVADSELIMSDGGRLEGVGVVPDELILPTGRDLRERRDPVMARALALVGLDVDPTAAARIYEEN